MNLEPLRSAVVGNLAYGNQRLVEMARALALDPHLLLLDEPTAGMNAEEKESMARFILDVHEEQGITVVVVDHSIDVIMDIADRVVVLDFGRRIAEGTSGGDPGRSRGHRCLPGRESRRFRPPGGPAVTGTLPGLLAQHAASRPDGVALREKEFGIWQEVTWAEYLARVRGFSLGLTELGVKEGDRIAIIGDNRPEWVIAELASQTAGVLPLGLYQDAIADELARILEAAEARVIVAEDQEQVDKVLEVRERLPGLERIVYYDRRGMYGYEAPGLMSFEEVEALGGGLHERSPGEFDRRLAGIRPGDVALLCTTSGTTSVPKLAMLSHENLLAMASQLQSVDAMHADDEFVSFLPLAWIGEQMVGVASGLLAGFTVNFPEETATARQDTREIGPAFLMSPPRIWENMVSGRAGHGRGHDPPQALDLPLGDAAGRRQGRSPLPGSKSRLRAEGRTPAGRLDGVPPGPRPVGARPGAAGLHRRRRARPPTSFASTTPSG